MKAKLITAACIACIILVAVGVAMVALAICTSDGYTANYLVLAGFAVIAFGAVGVQLLDSL